MKMFRIAPTEITKQQRKWLETEKIRTGNSFSAIIRGMLQDKVNAKAAK